MVKNELIAKFAEIQGLTYDEAATLINAESDEAILENIKKWTARKINESIKPNREQRRRFRRRKKEVAAAETIAETARKINYIDLIQKLRKLNEEKESELNGENVNKEN